MFLHISCSSPKKRVVRIPNEASNCNHISVIFPNLFFPLFPFWNYSHFKLLYPVNLSFKPSSCLWFSCTKEFLRKNSSAFNFLKFILNTNFLFFWIFAYFIFPILTPNITLDNWISRIILGKKKNQLDLTNGEKLWEF